MRNITRAVAGPDRLRPARRALSSLQFRLEALADSCTRSLPRRVSTTLASGVRMGRRNRVEHMEEGTSTVPKRTTAAGDGLDASAANRPEHGLVSRSVVLQCALRLVDRDGVDGLSMRRLSEAVGRDPTVIYRHVPNKAALLDGIAEIVLGKLRVDTADPDWAEQLRAVAHDFRRLALEHPNVVPLLVTRPLATPLGQRPPGMLRPLEDVVALLTSVGFSGVDALHIYRVLFGYLYGHILTELQEVVERPEESDDVLRLGLHRLAITEFPQVRALAPALGDYDGAAELDRALDVLFIGLAATVPAPRRSARKRARK